MSLSCWREIMVTLRGTSTMLSSMPNTELKGRAVGRICFSGATPLTLNFSSSITSSVAGAGEVDWADIRPRELTARNTVSDVRSKLIFIFSVKVACATSGKARHVPRKHWLSLNICRRGMDSADSPPPMRFTASALRLLSGLAALASLRAADDEAVIRPKVVVVAMFEAGQDTGDVPGEFQFWVEREHLDRIVPLPAAHHDVRANADGSVIGIVTGVGNSNAAATIMALGLDPRFDLRKSYWLVAGIAGGDPADISLGSAAWAEYVVDGELAHEIDAREMPPDWPTGYVPLRKSTPYEQPRLPPAETTDQVYHLEAGLVNWAYELTKDTPLADNEQMQRRRATYTGYPNAQRPPFVMKGDNLASSTYWHGKLLDQWANDWVRYFTDKHGNYVTTAMEDTGTLRSLTNLTHAGKVDVRRALVLRTVSNYDMQWPGATAAQSISGEKLGIYSAYRPSLEAAHAVGSRVVHALVAGWAGYEDTPPSAP